eukprot:gene11614-34322_t
MCPVPDNSTWWIQAEPRRGWITLWAISWAKPPTGNSTGIVLAQLKSLRSQDLGCNFTFTSHPSSQTLSMAEPDAKRPKSDGEEDPLDGEDPIIMEALNKLGEVQMKLDKVNDEASDKVLEVEQAYNKIRRPIYENRSAIIQSVPGFWLTTMLNHPILRDMATDDDVAVMSYCSEVDVGDFEDIKSGFKICFKFKGNPYFSNSTLTRSFCYAEDGSLDIKGDAPADAFPQTGTKRAHEPDYRLLSWFVAEETLESGLHDELADIIKEDIWPNPIKYFEGAEMGGVEEYDLAEGEMDEDEMVGEEEEEFDGQDMGEGEESDGGEGEVFEGEEAGEDEEELEEDEQPEA